MHKKLEKNDKNIKPEEQQEEKQENLELLKNLKNGQEIENKNSELKEAETSPPTRYNSGSIILAMENAGK